MYRRYVDDINVIMNAAKAGLRYVGGKVTQDGNVVELGQEVEADKRSMLLVQLIGNSIHPPTEVEVDYSSRHGDRKLPILDLTVWIEERENKTDGEQESDVKVVLNEFYYKDVASRSVINSRSAIPWGCKRTLLKQEELTILLKCSRELPWKTVVGHVNHMMLHLQYSGYDNKFPTEVLRSGLKA